MTVANPLGSNLYQPQQPRPPQQLATITTSSSTTTWPPPSGGTIVSSQLNDPAIWNIVRTPLPATSELNFGQGAVVIRGTSPLPNSWHRFWQRVVLGVTWKDLRPENDLEALRRLK
mgnify:CR=1 FL=1